jgi:superfamily II DNA or RNA helicase
LVDEPDRYAELIECIGPVVYTYNPAQALEDGILNTFQLINVGVEMPLDEKKMYDEAHMFVTDTLRQFGNNFTKAIEIAKNYKHPDTKLAQRLLQKISLRRMLYSNSSAKIPKVIELCERHKLDKVIIFNEFIGMAEDIYDKLIENSVPCGIYHSNAKDLQVIKDFTDGKIRVLVAVKSLNEGLNVKSANVGIMVSGNTVKRNTIQRLGRVIRKEKGKKAFFYQMYCHYTKEAVDVQKRNSLFRDLAETISWE